jgi:hypothetical protein
MSFLAHYKAQVQMLLWLFAADYDRNCTSICTRREIEEWSREEERFREEGHFVNRRRYYEVQFLKIFLSLYVTDTHTHTHSHTRTHFSLSLCLFSFLSVCLSVCLFVYLSIYRSIYLFVYFSICLFVFLSVSHFLTHLHYLKARKAGISRLSTTVVSSRAKGATKLKCNPQKNLATVAEVEVQ